MQAIDFFTIPQSTAHKQYEALRAFYVDARSATEVAQQFGYTLASFYSLNRDFKQWLQASQATEHFFVSPAQGRKPKDTTGTLTALIIQLRQQSLSVPDIKATLDGLDYDISESTIYRAHLRSFGFCAKMVDAVYCKYHGLFEQSDRFRMGNP